MKLSEKLAEIKQAEGKLMRLYDLRNSIAKKEFNKKMAEAVTQSEIDDQNKQFIEEKKMKIRDINSEIDVLRSTIASEKNAINKVNVESGLDKKLIQMKFLRLELSKLMALVKKDSFMGRGIDLDIDMWEELGVSERITKLENEKAKLDSSIQGMNWSQELKT